MHSLHRTGGVYNCREDHIFMSHINLQVVTRQGSLTQSKSTKSSTWEKALSRVFSLISQKRDVLQCSPTSAAQLYYVVQACAAPTVSEESRYYGALKD